MPPDDSYLRHQQQRWLRHDAHLWIRPDAARWVKPGFDPGEIYPTLKRKDEDERKAALRAEIAHGYRLLAVLREQLAEVKADRARRRGAHQEESKYSPSQPRVPAGNPDGGQWTDGDGASRTQNLAGDASRKPGIADPRVVSDADPESVRAGDQYAQAGGRRGGGTIRINGQTFEMTPGQAARLAIARARAEDATARVRKLDPDWKPSPSFHSSPEGLIRNYEASAAAAQTRANQLTGSGRPVDLLRERELGGHAIEVHVNRTDEAIAARAQRLALSEKESEEGGYRVGSFHSLEAADKLVNSTLARNQDKIDLVTSGRSPRQTLREEFSTATGKEAYVRNATSQAVIRETYGVVVVIVPEGSVPNGYRVDTAFPANFRR